MKSIATILIFIASILLLAWIARPIWDDVALLREQTSNINDTLSSLNEKLQYQKDLIEKYNSITDENLDRLENQHLPKKQDTGTMLITLEKIVSASDARMNNVDFKKVDQPRSAPLVISKAKTALQKNEPQNYQEQLFSLSITTSYENFKAILRAMEKNIRLIDVQSINFGSGSKGVYTFNISAKTYFRK